MYSTYNVLLYRYEKGDRIWIFLYDSFSIRLKTILNAFNVNVSLEILSENIQHIPLFIPFYHIMSLPSLPWPAFHSTFMSGHSEQL